MATILGNPASFTQFKTNETTKVTEEQSRFQALYDRMDKDSDLYRLKPYVFTNLKGKPVKNASNVTLNAPATFADKVQSALNSAHRTPSVISNSLADGEQTYIEKFIKAVEKEIDAQLEEMGQPSLMNFVVEQSCMRGRVAVRAAVVPDKETKKLEIRVDALDSRYFVYKMVRGGMLWGASFYNRTKADVLEEYGKEVADKELALIDYWDRQRNKVWIRTEDLYNEEHTLDYVPIALQVVPVGTMMRDANNIAYTGESIFRASRALFPELNKTATILQSLNVLRFRPPLKRKSDMGERAAALDEYPAQSGMVTNIDVRGDIDEIRAADVHAATRLFYNALENYLQRATLPAIDFGNLSFPLSAVAIGKLTENKDQIYVPRLQAIAKVYRRVMLMVIRQLVAMQGEIELGEDGMKETFSYKKLQGAFSIEYSFETVSPEQDIANYAVAQQASQFYDNKTILKKILKEPYPEEIENNRLVELAARTDPAVALFRMTHALIEKSKIEGDAAYEAKMVAARTLQLLTQQKTQDNLPEQAQEANTQATPQSLLPMISRGGGGGGGAATES